MLYIYFSTLKMGKKKLNMMGLEPTTLSFRSHALFTDLEIQFLFGDAFYAFCLNHDEENPLLMSESTYKRSVNVKRSLVSCVGVLRPFDTF